MYKKSVFRSLVLVSQLGITVITPILICTYIGYKLEERIKFPFIIIFLTLGLLAGVNMAYRLIRAVLKRDDMEKEAERREKQLNAIKKDTVKPKEKSRIIREEKDE